MNITSFCHSKMFLQCYQFFVHIFFLEFCYARIEFWTTIRRLRCSHCFKLTCKFFLQKKHMMMYLTHFQISRYFGINEMFSVNDKLTQISRLLDFYHDGHRFNTNLTSTDLGCGKDVVFISQFLVFFYRYNVKILYLQM